MENNPQTAAQKRRENFAAYKSVDYSGFIERLFARGVDFFIAAAFGYFIYKRTNINTALLSALGFDLLTRIILTFFLGCTIGKFIFGVRVISRSSYKLSIWQVIAREFAKYISGVFLNIGYISIIVSRRKRAWHDMIACTAVTSGGKDEAVYGRDIYKERPEKWYIWAALPITVIFLSTLIISVNRAADYTINNMAPIGLSEVINTTSVEYEYKLPSPSLGLAGVNKNVIQVGDVDGDGGYDIFKESITDNVITIKNIRFSASRVLDGDMGIVSDKKIIQFRMLDFNGDKKDELAVIFDDKTLKVYKLEGSAAELCSFGPVDNSNISAVIKGRPSPQLPYRLYIMGDKNKVSVLTMSSDNKIDSKKYELPGFYNFVGMDMGIFNDKNYLTALTDDNKLVFYSFNGSSYEKVKEMPVPVKGTISFAVKDLDSDGKNEVLISSPKDKDRPYQVLAAFDVSGDTMKPVWDGGQYYGIKDKKVELTFDDGMDIDGDDKFEAYMVNKKISGSDVKFTLFIFEGNKYLFEINDFLRSLSLKKYS